MKGVNCQYDTSIDKHVKMLNDLAVYKYVNWVWREFVYISTSRPLTETNIFFHTLITIPYHTIH